MGDLILLLRLPMPDLPMLPCCPLIEVLADVPDFRQHAVRGMGVLRTVHLTALMGGVSSRTWFMA